MREIIIEPTVINLTGLKFEHIKKMVEGMLLTVLNVNDKIFKRDISLFVRGKND